MDDLTLEQRIRRLEDIESVRDTWHEYMLLLDSRSWDGMRDVFTDDAMVELLGFDSGNGIYRGRGQIIDEFFGPISTPMAALRDHGSAPEPVVTLYQRGSTGHHGTNLRVQVSGESASTIAYFFETYRDLLVAGTYEHLMVRCADRWRIRSLRITTNYRQQLAVVSPRTTMMTHPGPQRLGDRSTMIKLSSTWHIPDTELPGDIERHYLRRYLPAIREVPGLRRHVLLKAIPQPIQYDGASRHPDCWRGEDLWFSSHDDFATATASLAWRAAAETGFFALVAGLRSDLGEVVEYIPDDRWGPGKVPPGTDTLMRATWHIPDGRQPEPIDRYFFEVHVPNVRGVPGMHRHAMVKAAEWPPGRPARWWRGGECWYDGKKDYKADREAHEKVRADGFAQLTAGIEYAYFLIEEEWLSLDGDGTTTTT